MAVELWLEVESACNLSCPFCYNYWRPHGNRLDSRLSRKDLWAGFRWLRETVPVKRVVLSGGEPLLRSDLEDIAEFWSGERCPIIVTTNGTLLTYNRVHTLLEAGVTAFQIPIHSTDRAVHNALSGRDCWEGTLRALTLLAEEDVPTSGVFVATGLNVSHAARVVGLLEVVGFNSLIFNRLVPKGVAAKNLDWLGLPSVGDLWSALRDANEVAVALGSRIVLGVPIDIEEEERRQLPSVQFGGCPVRMGQSRWTVGVDGRIRRCNQSAASVGRIGEPASMSVLASSSDGRVESKTGCQFLGATPLVQLEVSNTRSRRGEQHSTDQDGV